MNTPVEVMPCPFCGHRPSITIDETELSKAMASGDDDRQFKARIDCKSLTCRVHPHLGPTVFEDTEISGNAEKTRNAAVELWNKRG